MVELRCLRIATSPQTQGKVHHIADVNDTSVLNSRRPFAVTEVNANAPKFASFQMDCVCLHARLYRCAFVPFKCLHCSAITRRRHIYTAGWEAQPSGGKTVICYGSCLESNILSSKWRRCCSCGACGDSAGGWIPSPPPDSCNNSVPFSSLNDHSLNGLISVRGTL